MEEQEYQQMQREKRIVIIKKLQECRGNAGHHKRNYICLECRKAYNTAVECPVHKTKLKQFIGEVPRRAHLRKWRTLRNEYKNPN